MAHTETEFAKNNNQQTTDSRMENKKDSEEKKSKFPGKMAKANLAENSLGHFPMTKCRQTCNQRGHFSRYQLMQNQA